MTRDWEKDSMGDALPVPAEPRRAVAPIQAEAPAPVEETASLQRMHRLLRGRYLWTMLLAIGLGTAAGVAGYMLWKPKYETIAQVRVSPILPKIIFDTGQSDPLPMYDGYIASQMAMMESRRVIDRAMRKPQWRELKPDLSDHALKEFRESTALERERNSQIITIRFRDHSPEAAQAGAKSIVESYMEIFGEEDIKRRELQLNVLEQRRTALINQTKVLRDRIMEIAEAYGTDSLDATFEFKQEELQKIETALREVQMELVDIVNAVEQAPSTPEIKPYSLQEMAVNDRMIEKYVAEKERLELEIKELLYYRTEEHPKVKLARAQLANVQSQMDAYGAEYNKNVLANRLDADPLEAKIKRFDVLKSKAAQVKELAEATRQETMEVGRHGLTIKQLQQDVEASEKKLEETASRIDHLNVESSVSGRITVLSDGDRPGLPANMSQRIQLAALGGAGGSAAGVAIMLLVGMANRRYRYADETREGCPNVQVLGVLPELGGKTTSVEQAITAATGMHQIRARLQMGGMGQNQRVFAVTSATASEGKTSVACALGLSVAASGSKTIVVDFDLYGQGLSDCVGVRMQLGDLLMREGKIDDKQLQKALQRASRRKARLGDTLVELGYVSREEVESAVQKQAELNCGLADVLNGGQLDRCVINDLPDELSILPVGNTDGHDVSTLSPATIQRFIERLKQQYDVIIFDCGPSPASLDASLIVPHADGVLFVVSQGTRQDAVQRAFEHLGSIDAKMAGVIFNRATWRDLEWYGSQSRMSMGRGRINEMTGIPSGESASVEPLGPLAQATATYRRRRNNGASPLVWVDKA